MTVDVRSAYPMHKKGAHYVTDLVGICLLVDQPSGSQLPHSQ